MGAGNEGVPLREMKTQPTTPARRAEYHACWPAETPCEHATKPSWLTVWPLIRRPNAFRANADAANNPPRAISSNVWRSRSQVLAFLDDLTIPFDNNQAERDVRMFKVQQKLSPPPVTGGRERLCARALLSFHLRKQGGHLLHALRSTFAGPLVYPAFA